MAFFTYDRDVDSETQLLQKSYKIRLAIKTYLTNTQSCTDMRLPAGAAILGTSMEQKLNVAHWLKLVAA